MLWTRVTPTEQATPGSGQGPAVEVSWEIALDQRFKEVVRRGTVRTSAARDHTVKVDATRLSARVRGGERWVSHILDVRNVAH